MFHKYKTNLKYYLQKKKESIGIEEIANFWTCIDEYQFTVPIYSTKFQLNYVNKEKMHFLYQKNSYKN